MEVMIKLQSKDQFDSVAYLDPLNDEVQIVHDQRSPDSGIGEIQGTFSQLGEHMLYFYRTGEALYLRIDNQTVELTNKTEVNLERVDSQVNRLNVIREGSELLSFVYVVPSLDPPLLMDPTPFIGEEDYDFALFVYSITRNPEKRATIYR